jgi:hypothetical protein
MNNPVCPRCDHVFPWFAALRQIYGPSRAGRALWGAVCPSCGADLRVPTSRMLLIGAAGVFFGSQTSTLLVLGSLPPVGDWFARVFLILGFYAIATFCFLRLEPVS